MSTAPSVKFGATTAFGVSSPAVIEAISSRSDAVMPVVPTTACTPLRRHHRTLSITASGCVKSTATSACASDSASKRSVTSRPATRSPGCETSTPATSSRSSAAATASDTVRPIRPAAPRTPTRITARPATPSRSSRDVLAERPEDRRRHRLGEDAPSDPRRILDGHRVDPAQDLAHAQDLAVTDLGLAEPRHPPAPILEPEHEGALHMPLRTLELVRREPVLRDVLDLTSDDRDDLPGLRRRRPGVRAEHPGLGVLRVVAVRGVREAALLADLLEQSRGHPAAERRVHDAEREAIRVVAREPVRPDADVRLFGVTLPRDRVTRRPRRGLRRRSRRPVPGGDLPTDVHAAPQVGDEVLVADVARRHDDEVRRRVVLLPVPPDLVALGGLDAPLRPEDRTAERMVG